MLRQQIPLRHNRIRSSRRRRSQRVVPNSRHETHTLRLSSPNIRESTAGPRAAAPPTLQAPSNNRHRHRPNSPASRYILLPGKEAERKPATPAAQRAPRSPLRLEPKQETPKKVPRRPAPGIKPEIMGE